MVLQEIWNLSPASVILYGVDVTDVAVTVSGSQTGLMNTISRSCWECLSRYWRCGRQVYLYRGRYRNKAKHTSCSPLFSLVTVRSAEALLVCETPHSVVLAFFFFYLLFPLFLSSVPSLLTSSLPSPPITIIRPFPFFSSSLSSFQLHVLMLPTGPPTAAVVSAVSVLRPAGVGGWLAFVAVQESGRDDQDGPQEEHAVDDSGRHRQIEIL